MRDALAELSSMRKRGQRPEGPVVVTHASSIARYYAAPDRGMYVVLLGDAVAWTALTGLDVLLIDWEGEKKHVPAAQEILEARPAYFIASRWTSRVVEGMRISKTSTILGVA